MARLCKICINPKLLEIDDALVNGVPVSVVAKKHGFSYSELYCHKKYHLTLKKEMK